MMWKYSRFVALMQMCFYLSHGLVVKRDVRIQQTLRSGKYTHSTSRLAMIPAVETFLLEPYSRSLQEFPLLTKATTGFLLCGIADILAQTRANKPKPDGINALFLHSLENVNTTRLAKFASKGFFGAIIWGSWYDLSDNFISTSNIEHVLSQIDMRCNEVLSSSAAVNALRIASAIIIEQFVACPIIFGLWEIPAATLLNKSQIKRIPYEVKDKLNDMLIANAKVWTLANLIIYNTPLQYRVGLSNVIDIFWQSIVSDFAATCGNDEDEDFTFRE